MTLLEFFRNEKPNTHGKMFLDILDYDDVQFEKKHNFIQWMFPIDTKSNWNWSSPILTATDIDALNSDTFALEHVHLGIRRFMKFLGYDLVGHDILKAENYNERVQAWATKNNHNYKRISRFLRFAKMMGGEIEIIARNFTATQLTDLWEQHQDSIGIDTVSYWSEAIGIDIIN